MNSILFEKIGGVGKITLNRPEVFNSFNTVMGQEFIKRFDECEKDDEIRCILITGSGKAFCAGQDLAEVVDPEGPILKEIISERYNPIILRIRNVAKPVIAAVNGVAAGAGANIALACDICVAHEKASFIQAFSKIGLIPDSGGTFFLPRLIGFQKASAMMMLGDKVGAEEAKKIGMIYEFYSDDEFEENVESLARKMSKMATNGLALTKMALNQSMSNDLKEQLQLEGKLQSQASESYDYKEGVNAFLEKRMAEFKGK